MRNYALLVQKQSNNIHEVNTITEYCPQRFARKRIMRTLYTVVAWFFQFFADFCVKMLKLRGFLTIIILRGILYPIAINKS